MRRNILASALLCMLPILAFPQFALEHAYPNAGTPGSNNQLLMVHLEDLGDRYVFFDKAAKTLTLFDIDHIQTQTIDLNAVPDNGVPQTRQVLYITQYLFDLDAGIELLYFSAGGTGGATVMTSIVDESGAIIQSFPDEAAYVQTNFPQPHLPIYQSVEGAKMVLSHQTNLEARVYGLPGNLPLGMSPGGERLPLGNVRVYPNPASSGFLVELVGVDGVDGMLLRLHDQAGHVVLQQDVHSSTLSVERGSLAAGRYVYTIAQHGALWTTGSIVFE